MEAKNLAGAVVARLSGILSRPGLRCRVESVVAAGPTDYRVSVRCPPAAVAEVVRMVEADGAFKNVRLLTSMDDDWPDPGTPQGPEPEQAFDLVLSTTDQFGAGRPGRTVIDGRGCRVENGGKWQAPRHGHFRRVTRWNIAVLIPVAPRAVVALAALGGLRTWWSFC